MEPMQVFGDTALAPAGRAALHALPRQQAFWVVGSSLTAAVLGVSTLWSWVPELAMLVALGAGAAVVNPGRWWAAPVVVGMVCLAGVACGALGIPPVVGGGAMAGAAATLLLPQRTDALDVINGALGSLIGASLGLWAAVALLPVSLPDAALAPLTAAVVALLAGQGLLPVALRFDHGPTLPTRSDIQSALKARYRTPALRALTLYEKITPHVGDRETRHGIAEVVSWVFRLQVGLQSLDGDLEHIDVEEIESKIRSCEASEGADDFTRERRLATASHLRRLLEHRDAIALERDRTEALVDYALAFLAEARAGRTLARHLPGEHEPEQLEEVLDRLRNDAREGDLRRRAAREVDARAGRGYENQAVRQ